MILLFSPLYTQDVAATVITNVESSQALDTVEETRKGFNKDNFDSFIDKFRNLSIPVTVTYLVVAGLLFLIGFVVSPLRKIAFTIVGGVIVGFFFINYGEYLTGLLYAIFDFITSYF